MRTKKTIHLVIFILFIVLNCLSCQGITRQVEQKYPYWENLSKSQKDIILKTNNINKSVIKLYNGNLILQDDDESKQLLDTITSLKGEKAALYFYLFNRICTSSDGVISEVLGGYCQKVLLDDPSFAFTYLSNNEILFKKYAEYLGYELYFKEEGTSNIEYNFKDFKIKLSEKLKDENNLNEALILFYYEIEKTMIEMD